MGVKPDGFSPSHTSTTNNIVYHVLIESYYQTEKIKNKHFRANFTRFTAAKRILGNDEAEFLISLRLDP